MRRVGVRVSVSVWDEHRPRQEAVADALARAADAVAAGAPPVLADAVRYALLGPGKRLRPLLCALACEAAGGTLERSLTAGCAVEMVHTYSLVHDDLPAMDDDDLRRGRPTCHVKFGEAVAILAGDALLTHAFGILAAGYPPRTAAVSCAELATGAGAAGMVGGQVLDLAAEGRVEGSGTPVELEDIHRRKTGALFRAALRLGIHAARGEDGANPDTLADIDAYAGAFGLLFQVTDDLLDVTSSAAAAGKQVNKDAARGKLTYPGLLGLDASRRKAAALAADAEAAAARLGSAPLARLARYVVERDR